MFESAKRRMDRLYCILYGSQKKQSCVNYSMAKNVLEKLNFQKLMKSEG